MDRARDPDHPGLGESGKYHSKEDEHPLPEDTVLTYALVGNQNCGKTTLFNQLTGARQHVGNFPGVTVDRKTGVIRGYPNTEATDLPGIYSMSPFSSEEIVSRNFVLQDKPKAIINIVGRHQHRAKPVSDHAAAGNGHSHGGGAEHDG